MSTISITHRQLRANGIELHLAEAGDPKAPLLILLHGFPQFWFAWRDYLSPLAASGFHVVAPDQRGYNLSEKPPGIDSYQLSTLADDICDLARALGHETFQIVGHDWGGSVAWSIASSQRSSLLTRMVVLNAPHPAVWVRAMTDDPHQRRNSRYVRILRWPLLPETLLRLGRYQWLARPFEHAGPEPFTADVMQAYHTAWRRPGALTAMLNWYRALPRTSITAPMPGTLTTPCLILWGDRDPFAVPTLVERSAALCAQVEVVHLPGVGHWTLHEAHETVLSYLQRFLQLPQSTDLSIPTRRF
jgi:pimeloyl-ACP methyl ester carboxylesterase